MVVLEGRYIGRAHETELDVPILMDSMTTFITNWYALAVPVILLVIMICMGMELTTADFRRVAEFPRATLVGLVGQMIVLPIAALVFAHAPGLSPEVAIGIMIIAACPGGATSNVFSYLGRANIALSVTLTSFSSVLCFLTIPLWINLAIDTFGAGMAGGTTTVRLPVGRTVLQLFVVTLLPVAIGMGIRARWPEITERVRAPLRRAMAVLMGAALFLIVGSEWDEVFQHFQASAGAALLLVSAMLVIAYLLARAARLDGIDAFTISIEVGLQNGALATMIVVSLLARPELIVFPGTYAVLSLLPVALWTIVMRRASSLPPTAVG